MTDTRGAPVTAEGLLKDVKTFFDHGEFFRAYDLAVDALELFPAMLRSPTGRFSASPTPARPRLRSTNITNSASTSDSRLTSAVFSAD